MLQAIETVRESARPNPDYAFARDPVLRFEQRRLAAIVGYVAFGLPIVLMLGTIGSGLLKSISAYYYVPFLLGDFFVGGLIFVGALLLTYRGKSNTVAWLATIAGIAAYAVALVPTDGWCKAASGLCGRAWFARLDAWAHTIHIGSAILFFLILLWFCFLVFPAAETDVLLQENEKQKRNRIYKACGWFMILGMLVAASGFLISGLEEQRWRPVFIGETIMLFSFGVSWIVQGRLSNTALMDERDKLDRSAARSEGLA